VGHSSIAVTVDGSGHLVPGASDEARDRLEALSTEPSSTSRGGSPIPKCLDANGLEWTTGWRARDIR